MKWIYKGRFNRNILNGIHLGYFLSFSGLWSGGGGGLGRLGGLSFGRTGHLHGLQVLDGFSVSLLDLLQLGLEIV